MSRKSRGKTQRKTSKDARESKRKRIVEPKRYRRWILAGLAIVIACAAAGILSRKSRVPRNPDILLISIDTLRADHLGCYGYHRKTPNIDRLATRSIIFDAVVSPVPLTLPSHATMLTGLIPPRHGVRENAEYALPETVETVAEVLQREGYRTAAFIGGLPMERTGGLAQGFQIYDDEFFNIRSGGAGSERRKERYADEVLSKAVSWILDQDPDRPVFIFVHLYDPHAPGVRILPGQTEPSYDGEIYFVDQNLGWFFSRLSGNPRWKSMITLITSDHGEGLNQHGEETHGMFVYESTLRVPLIIHGLEGVAPCREQQTVGIVDIAPTILDLADAPAWTGIDGRSLLPVICGEIREGPEYYFETLFPRLRFGWSSLRGIRNGMLKYIDAPGKEVYDLSRDPDETANLYPEYAFSVEDFHGKLKNIGEGSHARILGNLDPDKLKALEALGYIAESAVFPDADLQSVDPKSQVENLQALRNARQLGLDGNYRESLDLYESLEPLFKGSPRFYDDWATVAFKAGKWSLAIRCNRKYLDIYPSSEHARFNLAIALWNSGDLKSALEELQAVLDINPANALAHLDAARLKKNLGKDPAGAAEHYRRFLNLAPTHPEADVARKELASLNR
ncbi:sulfatase-like hydrolase/transferase [bacterium]|nr:sulfatase-like hydrolase/transferase [candidate division CSSED10-310 bacterium]